MQFEKNFLPGNRLLMVRNYLSVELVLIHPYIQTLRDKNTGFIFAIQVSIDRFFVVTCLTDD